LEFEHWSKALTNPKYISKDRYKKQDGGDIKSKLHQILTLVIGVPSLLLSKLSPMLARESATWLPSLQIWELDKVIHLFEKKHCIVSSVS
jgi:hypothetical protein